MAGTAAPWAPRLGVRRDRPHAPPIRNPQYRPRLWPGDGGGTRPAFRGLGADHPQGPQRSLRSPLADPDIHGGAIIASGVENLAYEARRFVAADEKKAIGAAAAALIPNGCSLFINIGTTTEEVASALTSHEDLLVITNNLNVAMLLYRHPRIEVIVAGGAVRRADGAVIGSTAISLIGQFKVDYAIIGASAIDEEGALLDFDYREVQAAQAIIANARSVMLVANSTKLRRSAPVRIADISQINTFVTDVALPAGLANICQTRGIQVIEAMPQIVGRHGRAGRGTRIGRGGRAVAPFRYCFRFWL